MNERRMIQEYISRYVDDEVTSRERRLVELWLNEYTDCLAYYQELVHLDGLCRERPLEQISRDWERSVRASIMEVATKEDVKMKMKFPHKNVQIAVVVMVLVAGLLGTQVYIKRGIQGRLKQASDDIGDQYSGGNQGAVVTTWTQGSTRDTFSGGVTGSSLQRDDSIPENRKLIKRAEYQIEVVHAQKTFNRMHDLVDRLGGAIINSNLSSNASSKRKEGWITFKVRPEFFSIALKRVNQIGTVDAKTITSDDVSAEYVDLEARLKSAKEVRDRLKQILEEKAQLVKDILLVEQEIARLLEKIERIEGKMKFLDRQVAESTITVHYYEPYIYAPTVWSLGFTKKWRETLQTSAEILVQGFNLGFIVLAALLPLGIWVVLISLVIFGVLRMVVRKKR